MLHGFHLSLGLALAAAISISWRGTEAQVGAAKFAALVRQIRQLLSGRIRRSENRVRVEGRAGTRLASVTMGPRNGQMEVYCQFTCGPSANLQIVPGGEQPTSGQLKSYYQANVQVSRLHTVYTDDPKRLRALLSDESRLRQLRLLCTQKNSRVSLGGGKAEMLAPLPTGDDAFEQIEKMLRALETVAAGFERQAPQLPVSWARKFGGWFALGFGILVLVGILFGRHEASQAKGEAAQKPPELQHFTLEAPEGWRPVASEDFHKEDLGWLANYGQQALGQVFLDFDGSQRETGTALVLHRVGDPGGAFRVQVYEQGRLLADDTYPAIAFAIKVNVGNLGRTHWSGPAPARLPPSGVAFVVVLSRQDPDATVVYLYLDGKIEKYRASDFRAL